MKDVLTYKGFVGTVHYLSKEELFVGKVTNIKEDVSYEGNSHSTLIESFHKAVDGFLSKNEEQYMGALNCPIDKKLYDKLMTDAHNNGLTLNQHIIEILQRA